MKNNGRSHIFRVLGLLALLGAVTEALLPANPVIQPVSSASHADWHPDSFWHGGWGTSRVHKGIDIFAKRGTTVLAAQSGLVVYDGMIKQGGKVILVLTPRGWLHYYAHLDTIQAHAGTWVVPDQPIGKLGNSGNAAGKPPHLHYAVLTLVPRPWDIRWGTQGWKRMFYRDPAQLLP